MNKPTLVLDFDGVIHSYTSGWKRIDIIPDPPVDGAIEMLYEYIQHLDVCVFSSRSEDPKGIDAMQAWLSYWEGKYWEAHPEKPRPRTALIFCIRFPDKKPLAFVGLDDRVVTFTGKFPSAKTLLDFKPWNKK